MKSKVSVIPGAYRWTHGNGRAGGHSRVRSFAATAPAISVIPKLPKAGAEAPQAESDLEVTVTFGDPDTVWSTTQ